MLSIISKFLRHRWPLLSSKTDNIETLIIMESNKSNASRSLPERNLEFLELMGRLKASIPTLTIVSYDLLLLLDHYIIFSI